jgi:hypothetical protein
MRRRDRFIDYGQWRPPARQGTPGLYGPNFVGPPYQNSKVPAEWRKHALEPWRILFPDLEWTLPVHDD